MDRRFTSVHQSFAFSRRMAIVRGLQAGVGGLLIGRLGWLAIAQNQKYQLLSESNRVQLIPVPPRRGWIIDRNGKPIAINRASFRVDIIPQQLEKQRDVVPELARLLALTDDDVTRIRREKVIDWCAVVRRVGRLIGRASTGRSATPARHSTERCRSR
jgi:penicillin-binding protein 2